MLTPREHHRMDWAGWLTWLVCQSLAIKDIPIIVKLSVTCVIPLFIKRCTSSASSVAYFWPSTGDRTFSRNKAAVLERTNQ